MKFKSAVVKYEGCNGDTTIVIRPTFLGRLFSKVYLVETESEVETVRHYDYFPPMYINPSTNQRYGFTVHCIKKLVKIWRDWI